MKTHLVGDGSAVELDLHDVRLLLAAPEQLLLGVADDPHHGAVLLDLGQLLLDLLLAKVVLPLLAGLGEGLLLGLGPGRLNRGLERLGPAAERLRRRTPAGRGVSCSDGPIRGGRSPCQTLAPHRGRFKVPREEARLYQTRLRLRGGLPRLNPPLDWRRRKCGRPVR